MDINHFLSFVRARLLTTPLKERLLKFSAVVLERTARGGGATRWYWCPNLAGLAKIETLLQPGSALSFYFDGRISYRPYSPDILPILNSIIDKSKEIIIGVLDEDQITIIMQEITGPIELDAFVSALTPNKIVYYGAFPMRDNDGVNAITVILPDADGVYRPHPH